MGVIASTASTVLPDKAPPRGGISGEVQYDTDVGCPNGFMKRHEVSHWYEKGSLSWRK